MPASAASIAAAGQRPLYADETAAQLLRQSNLAGLGLHAAAGLVLPPDLPQRLGVAHAGAAARSAVPGGWLAASRLALHALAGGPAQHLLTLQLQRPLGVEVVRRVLALPLSPLQGDIALLAGLGHARADCHRLAGVSEAALKKHLRAIFAATGAADWEDLMQRLRR